MRSLILISVTSLLFLVMSALFWLTITESGLSTTMTVVQKLVPELAIKKVSGRLYTGAEFEQLSYQIDQDNHVTINHVRLSWQAMPLLSGRLVIDTLLLKDVVVTKKSVTPETNEPIVLPNILIPLPIAIENVQVNTLTYIDPTQQSVPILSGLRGALRMWGDNLKIRSLLLEHVEDKSLQISGTLKLAELYQTDLAYAWLVANPQLETIAAEGTIKGNLIELQLEQQLQKPLVSRQKLTIFDVLTTAKWQLEAMVPKLIIADFMADQPGQFNGVKITGEGDLSNAIIKFNSEYKQDDWPNLLWHGQLDSRDFDNWSVSSKVNADNGTSVSIQGQINTISTMPTVALSGQWQQLTWPLTQSEPRQTTFSPVGEFTLTGNQNNYALTLNGDLTTHKKIITFEASATATPQQITLTELQFGGLGGNAAMTGWFNWQQEDSRYHFDANLNGITLPKELSETTVVINGARLALAGSLADAVVNLNSELIVNAIPTNLKFTAHVTEQGAKNIIISSQIGKGKIDFIGESTWQNQLAVSGQVKFEKLNPKIVATEWPGELSGHWQMALSNSRNDSLDITLQDLNVSGVLRSRPLLVMADISYVSEQLKLPKLEIRSAKSIIIASGHMKETLSLNWQVTSPDLADFYPDLTGQLKASGTLTGNPVSPVIVTKVSGQKIGYTDVVTLSELDSEFSVDLSQQGYFKGKAALTELTINDSPAVNAKFDLSGQKNNHQLNFDVSDVELTASGHLSGELADEIWQGQLIELQLEHAKTGRWQLAKQGEITVASDHAEVKEHCLESKNGALCLQANYTTNDNWTAKGEFTSVPISLLQLFSTSLKSLQGNLNGQFELVGKAQYPLSGQGKISLNEGRLFLADNQLIEENQIALSEAYLDYELTTTRSVANILIAPALQGVSPIAGQVLLPDLKAVIEAPDKAELSGHFKATIEDLAVFDALHTEYENLHGKLKADIQLSGTAAKPDMAGQITLDDASVELSDLGIIVSAIKASAQGNLETGIKLNYQAKSGEGDLAGEGIIRFNDKGWQMSTTLKGSEVEMINLPEASVIASPDLKFEMSPNAAEVTGSVTIPSAALAPLQFSLPVTVSKDVIVINQKLEQNADSLPTCVNVNVILGDKVGVKGLGFEGRLIGRLLVTGSTDKILLGTGEVIIRNGSYIAYGQELVVDGGQILFSGGALDNPDLDIKAIREESDFIAGLQLVGPVNNPQILLFSTPAMSDDNVIAYLLLGRPFTEASASDGGMLAAAASGLGIKGGNMLGEKIASSFGLDTLGINGDGGGTALEIGKYLSPKLYLSYGVGIFESVNTINLRYKLNKIWTLEAESGEETGVDLFYVHER